MRGNKPEQLEAFSYITLEKRIPVNHPLRPIRALVENVLKEMNKDFNEIYSNTGRPSIPPEMLLKASFLQALYNIRSERLLLEQIDFNLLYRWFVGLSPDDKVWDESVFTKNRNRLLEGKIADSFFAKVVTIAGEKKLISNDHFTVDGTLIEAWASLKSFQKKEDDKEDRNDDGDPGNPSVDFHGEKRSNKTHESTTDPESKLYRKSNGTTAKLSFMGHVLMENRNGLAVEGTVTEAGYFAEHDAAIEMIDNFDNENKITLGADKHYDNNDFCQELRKRNVTPHVARNIHARKHFSAIDGRTTRHEGYEISQMKRKRVEEIFGWLKTWGPLRRLHLRGMRNIDYAYKFALAVYNVLRICNLEVATA
jgi:transposase